MGHHLLKLRARIKVGIFFWTQCSNYGSISCRYWDIKCRKMSWPWNPGQRSLEVIESGVIR